MEIAHLDPHASWQGRPLCCRYLLVRFVTGPIQSRADTTVHRWSAMWALGVLSDGQPEVLGVWHHPIEGVLNWQAVFEDLVVRGVEQIRFAVHADADTAHAAFPDLTVLDPTLPEIGDRQVSAGQGAPRSTEVRDAANERRRDASEMPRRVRLLARRTEEVVLLLRRGLNQAAIRHGPFESGSAAATFVEAWLSSAERRQRRRRLATYRTALLSG